MMKMNAFARWSAVWTCGLLLIVVFSLTPQLLADDFKPVNPAELAMKDNPAAPGAHAMILMWDRVKDDNEAFESDYYRVKIFTEEGKKYGDVEIEYVKGRDSISSIKARTIRPDGTIVPFTGEVYDKVVVKARKVKVMAKTFSLPDVQPGSVIEYKYRRTWDNQLLYGSRWTLQDRLYIKKAHLTLKPYLKGPYYATYLSLGVPEGKAVKNNNSSFDLDLDDIPAFEPEEYAPPEAELKPRIEFFYSERELKDANQFWKRVGNEMSGKVEDFIGKNRKGVQQEVAGLVSAGDTGEVKLRKLYARAQQVRNLSYESNKTTQEEKQENRKANRNVDDVLKNGYGYSREITRLLVAMARAAGMEANVVAVSQRDEVFFLKGLLDEKQLNGEIAVVKADGKDVYLDPSTPFCQLGVLSWENTGVYGLRLGKEESSFVVTPNMQSVNAVIRRTAKLKYQEDGSLNGSVRLAYFGQSALQKRLAMMDSDEAEQKKDFEETLQKLLPGGSVIKVSKIVGVAALVDPLEVEFEVEVPPVGSNVGSRILLPLSLFESNAKNPFQSTHRNFSVYFSYPFQELEEVVIELPENLTVEGLPAPKKHQTSFAYYDSVWGKQERNISLRRREVMGTLGFGKEGYDLLRGFYETVTTGDQENVVIRTQNHPAN